MPGGGGAEIQEEFASLIQPMLGNATNETCTDPFPVDIFNETIRQQGGYSKLALVCIEGTGLGIIGGDRLYMGHLPPPIGGRLSPHYTHARRSDARLRRR